jgi:hypothetical protein
MPPLCQAIASEQGEKIKLRQTADATPDVQQQNKGFKQE